ncbi:MAG: NAD-glutamate dehydrogenase [Myxococcales bacterium]
MADLDPQAPSPQPPRKTRARAPEPEPPTHDAGRRETYRDQLIEDIVQSLKDTSGEPSLLDPAVLTTFARTFLRRVDDRYLLGHPLAHLVAQLRDSLRFLSKRVSPTIRVRVFNPTEADNGYDLDKTVVETSMKDQPFIFDTILLLFQNLEVRVLKSVNVIIPVRRDGDGRTEAIGAGVEGAVNESYCRILIERVDSAEVREVYRQELHSRLRMSQMVVRDFYRMLKATKDVANDYEFLPRVHPDRARYFQEGREFLHWLAAENFVFMGLSHYAVGEGADIRVVPSEGLGLMAGNTQPSGVLTAETRAFLRLDRPAEPPFIEVRKALEESLVHRPGLIDEVLIRTFDDDGNPNGGVSIHGLFTFKAISAHGATIPMLTSKLQQVLKDEEVLPESYLWKATTNAFNSLPVEYLFNGSIGDIRKLIQRTLQSEREHRITTHISISARKHSAYLFIVLPTEIYDDELRSRLQDLVVGRLGATYADHRVSVGRYKAVVLHFYLTGGEGFHAVDEHLLEQEIVALCSPWTDRLRHVLEARFGVERAESLYTRWAASFPDSYQETTTAEEALVDIEHLEQLGDRQVAFRVLRAPEPGAILLRIYERENIYLTDILPILDHFGLRVVNQVATTLRLGDGERRVLDTFRIDTTSVAVDLGKDYERFIDGLYAVFERRMASDRLNGLLVQTAVSWKEVDLIRAYLNYSRLLASPYAHETVQGVLIDNPQVFQTLVELFRARFDPDLPDVARGARVAEVKEHLFDQLRVIKSYVDDRVLRSFFNLIEATLRTNFYRDGRLAHYISLKLDCPRVELMPDPRPRWEIYVHHADMEGIHLRGGKVARGGLRWSDRLDDYRAEILGLMMTQQVKNTLIVPVGAKGGFIVRAQAATIEERRQAADSMYKWLIRGLLDVTDNRVNGGVVPPPRVVRYDDDDPYLVVAADKGTAHLSDTANGLAVDEYGFWLGDAFASGGSAGYDHKKMAITALGAWECVKRHFRELGLHPERDVITVAGIGDMSGDVFGNGLILSKSVKLLAAFNHAHVFIDPSPDPAASWAERKRLFELPRSRWSDYDAALLSHGGGIYDRTAKAIELSPEAQAMLDVGRSTLSADEVVNAILKMKVDLLWNGGIGTYVKASTEDHRDAHDKANDRVRIDATELRARIIGEGGNLGFTQKGRIEAGLLGVRLNTDAVDNAGGVNLSDHEVNLKVLLTPMVRAGRMSLEERDALLVEVAGQCAEDVIRDNYHQSLRLSLDERRSKRDLFMFGRALHRLKHAGICTPRNENLPIIKTLRARAAAGQGMTRPELATAGAFIKMWVYRELLNAPRRDQESAALFLERYFPKTVWRRFGKDILEHMLAHEIVCTVQTNLTVDFGGTSLYTVCMNETDRPIPDIARAYVLANDILGAWEIKDEILRLDWAVPAEAQYEALTLLEDALRDATLWLLHELSPDALFEVHTDRVAALRLGVDALQSCTPACLSEGERATLKEGTERLAKAGLPAPLVERLKRAFLGGFALPILSVAEATDVAPAQAAEVFFALGDALKLIDLSRRLDLHVTDDRWEALAMRRMRRMFQMWHVELARKTVNHLEHPSSAAAAVEVPGSALASLATDLADAARDGFRLSALVVLSERFRKVVQAA